ncbi:MAG TPA: aspartate--tRNA ligase [Bacteroidia bacterium]|nr:aspartate--tRNA ligase [Bacteroidia bacterium]
MLRTHTCGELRISDVSKKVTLAGWVQRRRDLGNLTFIDIRDRYGITQLVFSSDINSELLDKARTVHREYVIQVSGTVRERESKNLNLPTGEIEIVVDEIKILNPSITPPFTIEDNTDGGEELRMKFRYLDLRRNPLKNNLILRHRLALETRKYLDSLNFLEIETPFLIKSTPEGARDFVVPSRMHKGEFYALPQSPQTFKQILMVAGYDRYFQIVRCFRDEDLRADRQPEFTQIDCEMSFIEREDILQTFEGLIRHLFKSVKGIELPAFQRMSYDDAMNYYGSDKPDLRFDLKFTHFTDIAKNKGFQVFDNAECIAGINVPLQANATRKQIDEWTNFVKDPKVGANGLIYIKYNSDGTIKSSIDKYLSENDLKQILQKANAKEGDLLLIIAGEKNKTLKALGQLRLHLAKQFNLIQENTFACLWVLDFPLFEYDEEEKRWVSMHHPFTSPIGDLSGDIASIKANAYDMVINGTEVGGGSIRIHNKEVQKQVFKLLGFTDEEAMKQFGFLMNAFEYGAPPHGGIAFGFDRLTAILCGSDSIRDVIAFPKNNAGKDTMIDAPSTINEKQLEELGLLIRQDNPQN